MILDTPFPTRSPLRAAISAAYLADEADTVKALLAHGKIDAAAQQRVEERARELVNNVRAAGTQDAGIEAFLHEYSLSSQEGIMLMCLAEALLRIPDDRTADALIQDKLSQGEWDDHLGHSHSLFVNASTWGLMLTGRFIKLEKEAVSQPDAWFKRFVARTGEPVVRLAMRQAMRIIGHQFVMGETIEQALDRSANAANRMYRHSFDMLGEAALTEKDAEQFFEAYQHAIAALAEARRAEDDLFSAPSISIKLSALHPRYSVAQRTRVLAELIPRLKTLAEHAKAADITLTVDAEESERLELSLDIFEAVFNLAELQHWHGFGLAVQAYQKRAPHVLEWLIDQAREAGKRIPVRLVKGAYWDSEIKRAQEQGLPHYPVYSRKYHTDVAYLACARRMMGAADAIYPQFATHNAHTLAYILETRPKNLAFEFQRLHGMGEALYQQIVGSDKLNIPCRVYAPVGGHRELLPYLVRRLLENGANTSFVHHIVDADISVESIIADPVAKSTERPGAHPKIPLPPELFSERRNSRGYLLADEPALNSLDEALGQWQHQEWRAQPIINGAPGEGPTKAVFEPANRQRPLGTVGAADEGMVDDALAAAHRAFSSWSRVPVDKRAACLDKAAELLEAHHAELLALCIREAGKCVPDAVAELREAVDYCRYYAAQARKLFAAPIKLPGPTGELNQLSMIGRGVFACISPWNFPLAIFTGQVAAALAAGNCVIAKPASQTPLIGHRVVALLHEAGVPTDVLHFLPGAGSVLGSTLAGDNRIAGIVFTGSTETARTINELIAARKGPIIPFIAETGGQNAMIVDSSALPDQVVVDAVNSAFNSAGQRCSALRVLFVQEDVADKVLELLAGAMREIRVGEPNLLHTDVGPVIDENARQTLAQHVAYLETFGQPIASAPLPHHLEHGVFFAPRAFRIDRLDRLSREVFGPILHVITYAASALDQVLADIDATGYGLTLGVHSRIDAVARHIAARAPAGNVYINRNMIGAVVGVQPFGGQRLSGTGPKAGGPHYLLRFCTEKTVSNNVAAVGGNTRLLSLEDEGP